MADVTNELMYELLKKIQADISSLKDGHRDFRQDVLSLRNQFHLLQGEFHLMQGDFNAVRTTIGHIDTRLDRIETRLELRELSEAQSRFESHP